MQSKLPVPSTSCCRLPLTVLLALTAYVMFPALSAAQTYYWDSDGSSPGAGLTPSGTWGTSAFWSTDSTGSSTTANITTTLLSTETFSAGSDATGSYTITENSTQNAKLLNINNGTVTFSGGLSISATPAALP